MPLVASAFIILGERVHTLPIPKGLLMRNVVVALW